MYCFKRTSFEAGPGSRGGNTAQPED